MTSSSSAMFTGIVSGIGRVVDRRRGLLRLEHAATAFRLQVGGSVAVNGVCLTAVGVDGPVFAAEVVPETLRRSNLGRLGVGDRVNLELPLGLEGGLDGHLVQGHVDGTTRVVALREVELGREVSFALPSHLAPYVAEKGSVAVDGVSLTVAGVDDARGTFTVALVPHTLAQTIAGEYVQGTLVNVEVDVVARYVERLIRHRAPGVGRP
ncbi:MAG TPA: riboflavin synthase [Candidatus Dormibacteraeota bacterium]|jgi:riboflavin synthase alpha subunit|nr:riboflavin synthase [Candidatus Dormibacteraeota bacterium]